MLGLQRMVMLRNRRVCVLGSDLNVDSSGSESETDHSEVNTGSDSDSD
jgi:hypothetical protein